MAKKGKADPVPGLAAPAEPGISACYDTPNAAGKNTADSTPRMSNGDCSARAPPTAGAVPASTVDAGIATVVDAATGLVRFTPVGATGVPLSLPGR